jgi:hypothetical protein
MKISLIFLVPLSWLAEERQPISLSLVAYGEDPPLKFHEGN